MIVDGQQRIARAVGLARNARVIGHVVEYGARLLFHEGPLLLNEHEFVALGGESPQSCRLERPDHGHLVNADAARLGRRVIDAQGAQAGNGIEVGLAGGDDAKARRSVRAETHAVELVSARIGLGTRQLETCQALVLTDWIVFHADVHTAFRHRRIVGQGNTHAVRID